ncbi:hypothetical protein CRG98_045033 [Punica granatum]|uniref:Uncharacterized protein n=1 Tax=Punica granatum TaxID=22663 RepID=A0A2I0HS89_PUNGR|nr:hypothetical protein CRG98_045033 [Punica granatum]
MLARRERTQSVMLADVLSCAKRRVRSRDVAWLRGVRKKLALPRKVHRSSGHGSPCRGRRVKVADGVRSCGLLLKLWLGDEFLIFLSSLPAKVIDHVVGEVDYGGCA